jgi:O-antigen ligase
VAVIMVVAFLAGLGNGAPTKAEMRTFAELLLGVGLYFVLWGLIDSPRLLRRAFLAVVVLGALSAAVGISLYVLPDGTQMGLLSRLSVLDYPSGPGVVRYINDDPARLQRATGTSIDPNSFGGMLAVVAALLAPQVISRFPILPRRRAMGLLAALVMALLITVSRGSLVGLAAGLAVIGLVRDRRVLVAVALGVAGLAGLAQLVPWTARYVANFTAGLAGRDLSTQMRFGEYRDALRLIARYPLLGVGFGSVRDIDLYRGVSSLYLIVSETMGLTGLVTLMAALGAVAAGIAAAWRRLPPGGPRSIALGSLAALTAALVSGVFDHYFFTYPHAFALLWILLALGARTESAFSTEIARS